MATNLWPTPQDYNEAVQNPQVCFSDPDLKNGRIETNTLGLPRAMTGAFASVYKLVNGDKSWAVRCFLTSRLDQKDRYKHISDFVLFDELECTIDFHYVEQGILVKGHWYPCLKMPWVDGDTLDQYLAKNYKNPSVMKHLLEEFHKLVDELECAGIGHGDLQHGNIIVSPEGLRLVDYDALFVPALLGRTSLEYGHPNYQHPERNEHHFDPDVDNFSCWLIHASLLILAIDPQLYERHYGGDECILFKRKDLVLPEQSELFKVLHNHTSQHVRDAATLIERMLWASPLSIPILDCPEGHLELLPTVRKAKTESALQRETAESDSAHSDAKKESSDSSHTTDITTPNRFDFIDDAAAYVQETSKKQSKKARAKKINELNQRRKKVLEDLHLFFAPHSWIHQHMGLALSHFDGANYDNALNTYLRIYKVMEKNQWRADESFFWCLMGLGYCSGLSDKTALAGNYFLLALKHAGTDMRSMRAALCLAVSRFEGGDAAGAFKLIKENWKPTADIEKAVELEVKNIFVLRQSAFELLIALGDNLISANAPNWNAALSAANILLDKLNRTDSLTLTENSASTILNLADFYFKNGELDRAHDVYQYVGRNAIKCGAMNFGCNALFCASSLHIFRLMAPATLKDVRLGPRLGHQPQAVPNQGENLRLISLTFESSYDVAEIRIREMIDRTRNYVPARALFDVLLDLNSLLRDRGLKGPALAAIEAAFKLSVVNGVDLNERLINELRAFEDDDVWICLSRTYLIEKRSMQPLVEFLAARPVYRPLLTLLGRKLAESDRTVTLSVFFMHLAYFAPQDFDELCKDFAPSSVKDWNGSQTIIMRALHQSANCFVTELDKLVAERNHLRADDIIKHLNALDAIRCYFRKNRYAVEAKWIEKMMMRPEISGHLLIWMRVLEIPQLTNLIKALIEDNDVATIAEFVLQLATSDRVQGLESLMRNLRTWGLQKTTLEALLLPAAERCQDNLARILDAAEPSDAGEQTGLSSRECLVQLKSLYRLKAISIDAGVEHAFDKVLCRLFTSARMAQLGLLMVDMATTKDSDLVGTMAIDMATFDKDMLESVLMNLAITRSIDSILPIYKALLQNGNAPNVVSLAKCAAENNRPEFFNALSVQLVRELPEQKLVSFANELEESDNEEAFNTFIRHLKLFDKKEVLQTILAQRATNAEKNSPIFEPERTELVKSIVRMHDLDAAADVIRLAALSSDSRLANILIDLEKAGLSQESRKAVLVKVIDLCAKTLEAYKVEMEKKSNRAARFKILASLNIEALDKLSPFFAEKVQDNDAILLMQDERFTAFTMNWILELAERSELQKIASVAVTASLLQNEALLFGMFVGLARAQQLRPLITASQKLLAVGHHHNLIVLANELAANKLDDAFGSVSLEIVTANSCDNKTLLKLLKTIAISNRELLKVVIRQISFYRGKDTLKAICRDWSESVGSGGGLRPSLIYDESRSMGLIP